jgi:hypothetical protein
MSCDAAGHPATNTAGAPVTTTTHPRVGTAVPWKPRTTGRDGPRGRRNAHLQLFEAARRRLRGRDLLACWLWAPAAASASEFGDPAPLVGPNGHVVWTETWNRTR